MVNISFLHACLAVKISTGFRKYVSRNLWNSANNSSKAHFYIDSFSNDNTWNSVESWGVKIEIKKTAKEQTGLVSSLDWVFWGICGLFTKWCIYVDTAKLTWLILTVVILPDYYIWQHPLASIDGNIVRRPTQLGQGWKIKAVTSKQSSLHMATKETAI